MFSQVYGDAATCYIFNVDEESPEAVVELTKVECCEPPVRMASVLAWIDQSEGARADFDSRVVRITESEFETANTIAMPSRPRPPRAGSPRPM